MLSLLTSLGLEQMLGCLRAAVLTCFLWMHLSATEFFFTAPPEDLVGLPDGPLVLPCPVYNPNRKGAQTVHWERGSGSSLPGPEKRIHQLSNGSLFFSHLWEEDFGIYLCQVQDGTDRIRATVRVKKAGMEAVFFSPKSQLVPEGDSVFLQCISGDSWPPAHITWEKGGSPVTKGTQIQGQYGGGSHLKTTGTLYLADVSKDDEGEYICVTHNPLLSIRLQSAAATLTVQGHHATPKIIKGPENITVAMDTEAFLHCAIQGFPLPMVHWFKNSIPLQNDSRWSLSNSGQLLVFSKVSEEDEGFYHCEARGLKTSVRSQPAYLQTAEMEWSFMQQPVNTTAQAGDSVTLICTPPRSRPPARVTWFKNGRPLTHKPHFSQLPSGDLLFHRLQETDRGSFFCRASNSLLSRAVSSRKAYLNVQVLVPHTVPHAGHMLVLPTVITAVSGAVIPESLTLRDAVAQVGDYSAGFEINAALPSVRISTAQDHVVKAGISNATLYFSSVKAYDEGSYTCQATNTVGRAQGTASVRVAVSPVIISFPREVRSSVGVSVVLPCQAVGSSPIRYTWNQGPGQTPISSSSRIHVDEDGVLNIAWLERSDAGEYHCIAENVAGRDQRTANVIVLAEEDVTERGRVSTVDNVVQGSPTPVLESYCPVGFRSYLASDEPHHFSGGMKAAGSIKISNSSEPSGFRSSTLTPEDVESVVRPRDITDHSAQGSAPSPGPAWLPGILSESATAQVTQRDRRVRATPVFSPGSEQALVSEKTASQMTLGLSELGRGHLVPGLPPSFHLQPADLQTPSSEVYSPPAFFHSKSTKNQTTPTYLYSSPTFFHSTLPDNQSSPSYQYSPPTTFQSHSTENQTPPPDLYSPPTTFQSHSSENQTPPPDLYSPPTTFQSHSTENRTPPPDLYSPPTTFQSHSTENRTPPPALYSPPTTFQSHSTENRTPPPDLYSPPTTVLSRSTENQTPPPDLYSPPTTFQSLSIENKTPPPDLYSPPTTFQSLSNENQTPPPDLYSPPTTFQSLSTENQTPPPDLYSPPTTFHSLSIENQTPPPDLYSPPTTFQSLSTENQTPPPDLYSLPTTFQSHSTENQTPPPDLYSPPTTFQSHSAENQTPPPDLYSPPTTFHSLSTENQTPPSDLYSPPTTFQSLSTENQTPPPDLYSPPTTFQSHSTENQTPPPDLYSPPTTFHSLSTENQTPPPDLYSPPTTFQSHSTENQTPPPDLYSPPTTFQSHSTENQTPPPDLYSPHTTFQSLSTENQTPPPDLYSPPTSFQFQSPEASPDYLYIPHVNLLSLAPGSHTSHPVAPTQPTKPLTTSIGSGLSRKDDIISTVPKPQDWNPPTRPDKPSNTELTEWPRKNTSQAPMRTSDDTARVKQHHPLSWFPALEKHDIPIVVGVGVSLTFIFITMAFYSLVQKNDPALAGRGAQRGLGAPCRRGGRLEIRRTYENRAFEDDDFVAVIEQSPDTFGTRAPLPTPGAKTGMTESPGDTQLPPDSPVPAQLDTEHRNELQMVCHSEREKHPPSAQPSVRLGDSEDWRPCPDPLLPLPASPKPSREDGFHTSLTLQTSEAFTTPVSHSVNISHASGPLLLSHCVSVGVTTVAVDVHFYPSAPTSPPPPPGSRLPDSPESDRVTPTMQCEHRLCL